MLVSSVLVFLQSGERACGETEYCSTSRETIPTIRDNQLTGLPIAALAIS